MTIMQILLGISYKLDLVSALIMKCVEIQDLLTNPNIDNPHQREAFEVYVNNRDDYNRRIKEQARKYKLGA